MFFIWDNFSFLVNGLYFGSILICNVHLLFNFLIILSDVVRFPEDLDDESTTFHPEYSHQMYGDEYVSQYCILDSYIFNSCECVFFSWHHYFDPFLQSLCFVFTQWSGFWLQRSSDPAVLQCREPEHPVQSQVHGQGHREVWLCGGTTCSFYVIHVHLTYCVDMHSFHVHTVQWKIYICITFWTKSAQVESSI